MSRAEIMKALPMVGSYAREGWRHMSAGAHSISARGTLRRATGVWLIKLDGDVVNVCPKATVKGTAPLAVGLRVESHRPGLERRKGRHLRPA